MIPWSEAETNDLIVAPYDYARFKVKHPHRTKKAFQIKRQMLDLSGSHLVLRPDTTQDEPIFWDKKTEDLSWRDFIGPMDRMQELAERLKTSQDTSTIVIPTDRPFPLIFIGDWHIGSWGTSARVLCETTDRLLNLWHEQGARIVCLGDMLQMAIKLRGMLEVSDNLLPPRMQDVMLGKWLEDMGHLILWSVWDNHAVIRQEDLIGFSPYAEHFKGTTIYHAGIGHTSLTIGDVTYDIASSHKFRGRSKNNPLASQMEYMRRESPERDLAVAADSHTPAIMAYWEGGKERVAVNCGTLQTGSGYSSRYFSLNTSDAMPVVVFDPDTKRMTPYFSLDSYESSLRSS